MSSKIRMEKSTSTKTINIFLGNGRFTEADAFEFMNTYKSTVRDIKPNEYSLNVECREMSVAPEGPMMRDCLNLYKEQNFKKISVTISKKQVVLGMQFKRQSKELGLNIEIITI